MSHGRNRRNKARRRALFAALPEMKTAYRFVRQGKQARWIFRRHPKTGEMIKRRVPTTQKEKSAKGAGRRIYRHPWPVADAILLQIRELMLAKLSAEKRQ